MTTDTRSPSTRRLAEHEDRCYWGFHVVQHPQLCSCEGLAAKAQGQSLATAAHPTEAAAVDAAIRRLAATGRPFSANDARVIHGVTGGVVGARFTAARKAGLIVHVGYEQSSKASTHAHPVAIWRAA